MRQKMGAVRWAGLAPSLDDPGQIVHPRFGQLESALSNWRFHWSSVDFDRRFLCVSAFPRAETKAKSLPLN